MTARLYHLALHRAATAELVTKRRNVGASVMRAAKLYRTAKSLEQLLEESVAEPVKPVDVRREEASRGMR